MGIQVLCVRGCGTLVSAPGMACTKCLPELSFIPDVARQARMQPLPAPVPVVPLALKLRYRNPGEFLYNDVPTDRELSVSTGAVMEFRVYPNSVQGYAALDSTHWSGLAQGCSGTGKSKNVTFSGSGNYVVAASLNGALAVAIVVAA